MENTINTTVLSNRKFQYKFLFFNQITWIFNEDGTKVTIKAVQFGIPFVNSSVNVESLGGGRFVGKGPIPQEFSLEGNRIKIPNGYLTEIFE